MPKSNPKENILYMDYASSFEPNPSSIHDLGVSEKNKLEEARRIVSEVLHSHKDEIIFTSGGTESNNIAIWGTVWKAFEIETYSLTKYFLNSLEKPSSFFSLNSQSEKVFNSKNYLKNTGIQDTSFFRKNKKDFLKLLKPPHIITTNIEHPSILETFRIIAKRKMAEVSIVPVEKNGIVDPKKIRNELKENTVLVSVGYVNNEIGTIQPIREIAKEIRHFKKYRLEENIQNRKTKKISLPKNFNDSNKSNQNSNFIKEFPYFHTDAVQAVHYLNLNIEQLGVDMLSLSGTKIGGARGAGMLYKKKTIQLAQVFGGGDQEFGMRPGTENTDTIVKFAKRLSFVQKKKEIKTKELLLLRNYFFEKIKKLIPEVIINGDIENRLPNNVNITIPKIPSDLLVIELSKKGIMISEKSACKSGDKKASYVIKAIRTKASCDETLFGSLRFSFSDTVTKKQIDDTLQSLVSIIKKLKKWYN